jgi:hypothetical protein
MVFRHYARQRSLSQQRYQVVNAVPALRDKELVTVFRYEQLFNRYLRKTVPGMEPLEGIRFTSSVVSTNNYFLRRLIRDATPPTEAELREALNDVRHLHGVLEGDASEKVIVAIVPRAFTGDALVRKLRQAVEQAKRQGSE